MKNKDYYSILEINKDASSKNIRDAYRKLALIYHPDRNPGSDASAKMSEINEAYAVLSDPEKRAAFDEIHHKFGSNAREKFRSSYSEQDIYKNSDIDKIFEELSKMFGLRNYEEVFRELLKHGKKKDRVFPFKWNWLKKITKDIKEISFASRSLDFLKKLAAFGRIYDKTQHDTIYITPELAMTGGKISYLSSVTGKKLIVTIPKWVKDGTEIQLKGMGHEHKKKSEDLFLKIRVRRKPFKYFKNIKDIFKRNK